MILQPPFPGANIVHLMDTAGLLPPLIFVGAMISAGIVVMLVHCACIQRCIFLSRPRRPEHRRDEETTTPTLFPERRPLLRSSSSNVSIRSSRPTYTEAWGSSLPQFSTFDTQYRSALRLHLPSEPNSDLEIIDHVVLLDHFEDSNSFPTSPSSFCVFKFPNTQYVGFPGLCFAKAEKWGAAVRWAKNGGKWIEVRFWAWSGRELTARIGLAEDGSIEAIGLTDVLRAIEKGRSGA